MIFQCQIPIGSLPINLVLVGNKEVAGVVFVKVSSFGVIFDMHNDGIQAIFHEDCFTLGGEEFDYEVMYEYKNIPNMLKWLQQQNLQEPHVVFM